ncbi:MAG: phosphoribosylformylglycinamidine synthase [Firmicutes bacterium]|nr:phosphoribosylformylglycinamidine synthase [Bacillota bacterium]
MVFRIFVEKKPAHALEAAGVYRDLKSSLLIGELDGVRVINRYDVENISSEIFEKALTTVFSEPQTDDIFTELSAEDGDRVFAVEPLPGQFDQRADSCSQCIQLLTCENRPPVRAAKVYVISGGVSDADFERIKRYIINPVESREASLSKPESLVSDFPAPPDVSVLSGFCEKDPAEICREYSLAMDDADVRFCQDYFKNTEKRDPTLTELRLIDTYWSDHCRHTTFLTRLSDVEIEDENVKRVFDNYLRVKSELYPGRDRPASLMDIATIAAKYLRKNGYLDDLDVSEEINACSVHVKIDVDGGEEDWLLMFKNETHNHPTEIEPFGGAATCLGGAIRDPLSGRSYVYQAMRVTGCADPRTPVSETMPGKLPQSKLTLGAASGYSSYGNQIGLSTGGVYEIYHPGYVAKRLEIGAVIGAAPAENVVRAEPEPGDAVVLLGGRTGRDGCGGATGSSKAHGADSLASCGAEVQKGNPPEERKIQRLFRDPETARMIKRCNDFGAGGVSVAVGELADGLDIDLDRVPKKYEGLDGTELAISESQERMAVVVSPGDVGKFIEKASAENLEATVIAVVTDSERMKMTWRGKTVADLSRGFLSSNGAPKSAGARIGRICLSGLNDGPDVRGEGVEIFEKLMGDLNICCQKGLSERFDSSIGGASVMMPFGGKYQLTPEQYMAAKFPVLSGKTDSASVMAYGFDPYLSEKSPFHGAAWAVVESAAKVAASGAPYEKIRLTFQEYFGRTGSDPERWGKPLAALLGAYDAQLGLKLPSIGGKDSMSGTFEHIDVPPTLVSFAVAAGKASKLVSSEFKAPGHNVYLIMPSERADGMPDYDSISNVFGRINGLIKEGKACAVRTITYGGIASAVVLMMLGNKIGFEFAEDFDTEFLLRRRGGAFIVETEETLEDALLIGRTSDVRTLAYKNGTVSLDRLEKAWKEPLSKVFPLKAEGEEEGSAAAFSCSKRSSCAPKVGTAKPKVVIPVFPGTNCEYDSARAFINAGAEVSMVVLRNLTPDMLTESISEFASELKNAQILMLPGGFSGGDEPDGSGKFITAVLRNPMIKEEVTALLDDRLGLVLGICNGFQALVKSGLLPYGRILDKMTPDSPTLTYNKIARHQSMMVTTRVASVDSPWMSGYSVGDIHVVPVSHGEGRFCAPEAVLEKLAAEGRIATQYVSPDDGLPTLDGRYCPNGSALAIEGILSSDGRILGKMGHSERAGENIAKNVPGENQLGIFRNGVKYFN